MTIRRFVPGSRLRRRLLACAAMGAAALLPRLAQAQVGSDRYASIVVDSGSGALLSAANPDELRHPASLTKMMTLYMTFEALRDRRITLDQPVPVSPHAASMSPTKLGLVPGTYITVEQAILGLVTLSANDAASALGELMGGDEDRFAQMMTLRARALGMQRTQFENASGLPDPDQVTTARDMAVLARHLIQDYPTEYHYFSTPEFVFHGRTILNHDHLLITYPGADGMKTGYTRASGYNLVTSAVHGETRLIGVVLGAASGGERDRHMEALLDQAFQQDGVPVLVAHRDVPWHVAQASVNQAPSPQYPSLMAAAHADTLPAALPTRREAGVSLRMAAAYGMPRGEGRGRGRRHEWSQVVDAGPVRRAGFSRAVEVAEAPGEMPRGAHVRHVQAIEPAAFEAAPGHAHRHGTAGRKHLS